MYSFIISAYLKSDFFGKFIFLMLLSLSIISISLIVYKCWANYWVEKISKEILDLFSQKKNNPLGVNLAHSSTPYDLPNPMQSIYGKVKDQALTILKKNKSYFSSLENKQPTLLSSTDIEQIDSLASSAIASERKKVGRYLFVLSTIASLSTLLGLLGTVWGISVTFSTLPNSSNIMSNDQVLSGLALALATTVVGILIAIPAIVAHGYLKHQLDEFTQKMDDFSSDLVGSIELYYRAVR